MSGRSATDDPLKAFRFRLFMEGFARAGFSEFNGFERTTEVVEYREGGMNATPRKSAGLTSYGNLTGRRGQVVGGTEGGENDFYEWAQDVFDVTSAGAPLEYRRTFDVAQYHRDNKEAVRWTVYEAFPTRFKPFSDLNGTSNDDSIEDLELAHEGWEKV